MDDDWVYPYGHGNHHIKIIKQHQRRCNEYATCNEDAMNIPWTTEHEMNMQWASNEHSMNDSNLQSCCQRCMLSSGILGLLVVWRQGPRSQRYGRFISSFLILFWIFGTFFKYILAWLYLFWSGKSFSISLDVLKMSRMTFRSRRCRFLFLALRQITMATRSRLTRPRDFTEVGQLFWLCLCGPAFGPCELLSSSLPLTITV